MLHDIVLQATFIRVDTQAWDRYRAANFAVARNGGKERKLIIMLRTIVLLTYDLYIP